MLALKSTFRESRIWFWSHHFVANRWGNSGNSNRLYFLRSKITADGDCSHEIKRLSLENSYDKSRQHIKKQRQNK